MHSKREYFEYSTPCLEDQYVGYINGSRVLLLLKNITNSCQLYEYGKKCIKFWTNISNNVFIILNIVLFID